MLIEGPLKHGFDTPIWACRRVVFIDESGLTQIPTDRVSHMGTRRTTPIFTHVGSWKKISVIGAITQENLYFQIVKGAAKQEDIIHSLKSSLRNIPGKLIII
ncbi:hypothetical protein LEP1GSC175_3085 [Leptospira santarosai str. HAI821]|uniref:hypothetical protein n=1 Tax=Leptospira santarosai TaxID=28183 RepID=UPI0002BEBE78|nr:hypothetical protein [Leptospira santarosai]EMO31898.1 hypothetical protein LEP1GSC175_3085 [Leptospira santarosai str. HAI821]